MIFNIAIGEDDNDGNDPDPETEPRAGHNITALLTEAGGDKVKFPNTSGPRVYRRIPAASYARAIAALEKKRGAA